MPAVPRPIRFAAAGDIHADDANRDDLARAFRGVDATVDLILLAGDLTTYGQPEQAALLAEICRPLEVPVYAVLGNHDWHCNQVPEIVALLSSAGVRVLDRSWAIEEIDGASVGVVGLKGFIGGFPDSQLPDFGEPLLRQVYAETTDEVDALAAGLEAVAGSDHRIVLLHYSPTASTLEGEPRGIWPFLGTDRLAEPIAEHKPDVVLHGHTHAGTFEGSVGSVPVFNVAVPVIGRDFFVFELDGATVHAAA
ncbi:MAG: metallophosphoesterase [Actinobacteria bacterium]|nr:MAG: metallophosphoesterase [Actinomycetota bacterium]